MPQALRAPVLLPPADRVRLFPTLDRAFDAVERALGRLGIPDPAELRSPRPVEEALSATALPPGTLLVLDPSELRAAEVDVEDTVKDERTGGAVFLTLPKERAAHESRKRMVRELAGIVPTYAFLASTGQTTGLRRVRHVPADARPEALDAYRVLLADTPGFRVAVVCRELPSGGFVGLWTGNEDAIEELGAVLRLAALEAGHEVPEPAPALPALEGVLDARDVWRQAEDLRAYRVVREAELRDIARRAALKGVALRRARDGERAAG
jgi:hypothetical protein